MERQRSLEREREKIKQEYEIKALKAEEKRKADEAHEKEERKRIMAEYEQRMREESEERKAEEERLRDKFEREKREAKEKKEREYAAFLAEQKAKEEEAKAKKKKEEEEFQDEMRKRLARFGYTQAQIEAMVKEETAAKTDSRTTMTTTTMTRWNGNPNPIYPKIHMKYHAVDTLRYYELPWEYDSVSTNGQTDRLVFANISQYDSNYIIIKREMDKSETDVLFEHTRRLRSRKLIADAPKKEKEYAWYRKRNRSGSRVRKVGILEFKN